MRFNGRGSGGVYRLKGFDFLPREGLRGVDIRGEAAVVCFSFDEVEVAPEEVAHEPAVQDGDGL